MPEFITKVFKNGLVINHICSDFPGNFRIELIVRAGAQDEKVNEMGLAHFIEHLMSFFPSGKYPSSIENQQSLNSKNVNLNAWTEPNTVGYYMESNEKHTGLLIDMMLENYINPVLDPKVFEQERNAVLAELSSLINTSSYGTDQAIDFVNFPNSNLSFTTQFEHDNVKNNATLENIMEFRKRLYKPEFTSIILVSNRDKKEAESLIECISKKYISKMEKTAKCSPKNYNNNNLSKFGNYTRITITEPDVYEIKDNEEIPVAEVINEYDNNNEKELITKLFPKSGIYYTDPGGEMSNVNITFRFPLNIDYFETEKIIALEFLEMILSRGLGSRLYYALRTNLGAVYNVNVEVYTDPRTKDFSCLIISTETTPEKIKDTFDYILIELANLVNNENIENYITENEFSQYTDSIEDDENNSKHSMNSYKWLNFYKPYLLWGKKAPSTEDIFIMKRGITTEKIRKVANEIINPYNMQVFYTGTEPYLKTENNKGCHFEVNVDDIDNFKLNSK